MPELPEVEIVARSLDRLVSGRRIETAKLLRPRLAPDCTPNSFARRLKRSAIRSVGRRGKHILFDLDNDKTLITHLRMSGKFMLLDAEIEDPKFTHAILFLDNEKRLVFRDQRHFGLMKIVPTSELHSARELSKLAPEPFSEEFSEYYLYETLRASVRILKEFLLDQTKVCGLGNIYASEVMFLARVNPKIRTNRITKKTAALLHASIRSVLDEALTLLARTPLDPTNIGEGVYGNGSESRWQVYDRENEDCLTCGAPIVRITQAGRSTYYCRLCQRR